MDKNNLEFVRLLAESGFSGAEVARRLAIDPSTVSQYRSGTTTPSMTVLRLFSMITRIPLRLKDAGPSDLVMGEPGTRPLEMWEDELLKDLRELPEARRAEVMRNIQGIIRLAAPPGQVKYPDPVGSAEIMGSDREGYGGSSAQRVSQKLKHLVSAEVEKIKTDPKALPNAGDDGGVTLSRRATAPKRVEKVRAPKTS